MSQTNPIISKTCVTCRFGRELSTFPLCEDCLKNGERGNQFPEWKPKK